MEKTIKVVLDAGVPSASSKEYFVRILEARVVTVPVRANDIDEAKKLAVGIYREMNEKEFMDHSEYYEGYDDNGKVLDVENDEGFTIDK